MKNFINTGNQLLADYYFARHKDRIYQQPVNKYMIVGDRVEECRTVVVHEFVVSDVEDPDLYAADPLIAWQESSAGQWVIENSADTPTWNRVIDPISFGYKYRITAKLMGPALTEWLLRHGK
jgi:hypothetical protein